MGIRELAIFFQIFGCPLVVILRFKRVGLLPVILLKQLDGIAVHRWQTAGNVCLQMGARQSDCIMSKGNGVAHDFCEGDGLEARVIFSDEGLQVRDDVRCLFVLLHNILQDIA